MTECERCGEWVGAEHICTAVVHVQLAERATFCDSGETQVRAIQLNAWRVAPEKIQLATCQACLLRLFMIGDHAAFALKRMGLEVQVHNVDDAPVEAREDMAS